MNYQKLYNAIIDNRLSKELYGYTETHHIVPRSLGGGNDKANLVSLSAREHFICHYLLAKMYPEGSFEWYKTNHAFMMMKCASINQERYLNSRLYESLKCHHSSLMSIAQSGKNNSQYGLIWISNVELKESKKISKNDDIPDGWVKGRSVWNEKRRNQDQHIKSWLQYQKKIKREEEKRRIEAEKNRLKENYKSTQRDLALKYLDIYVEHRCYNLNELHELIGYESSPQSLVHFLKRYAEGEYKTIIQPRFKGKKHNRMEGADEVSNWS